MGSQDVLPLNLIAFPSRGRCPAGADRVTMAWKTAGIRFPRHSYENCKSPVADGTRKWDDRYFTSPFFFLALVDALIWHTLQRRRKSTLPVKGLAKEERGSLSAWNEGGISPEKYQNIKLHTIPIYNCYKIILYEKLTPFMKNTIYFFNLYF